MSRWIPMSWLITERSMSDYVKQTWPQLYVEQALASSKTYVTIHYDSDHMSFCFEVTGDKSPYLLPDAVEPYLYIHWPEYFRRGSDGQAPE